MAESTLSSFAYKIAEAVSILAITGAGWKVAIWVLRLLGI